MNDQDNCFVRKNKEILHYAVYKHNVVLFDYLMSIEGIDLNFRDHGGRSPIFYAADDDLNVPEYFLQKLIAHGADVNLRDRAQDVPLHLTFQTNKIKMLTENGADVNARNQFGQTPLHKMVINRAVENIYVLLYYGADVLIEDDFRETPLKIWIRWNAFYPIAHEGVRDMERVLFNYSFDGLDPAHSFQLLILTLRLQFPLFHEILEKITYIDPSGVEASYVIDSILRSELEDLQKTIDKFGHSLREIFEEKYEVMIEVLERYSRKMLYNLFVLLDRGLLDQVIPEIFCNLKIIFLMIQFFRDQFTLDIITERSCHLLSNGYVASMKDLNAVYFHYRYCELFKIMLHTDVLVDNDSTMIIPSLIYQIHKNITEIIEPDVAYSPLAIQGLFNYVVYPELYEKYWDELEPQFKRDMGNFPKMKSLLELARDSAREYIIKYYKIKNFGQFDCILRKLSIPTICEKILRYEAPIY